MATIRLMSKKDLDDVAQIDVLAFTEYDRPTGRNIPIPPRTENNLLACLDMNPTGCFIAETNRAIGYIFSRIWGKVGWVGVFGVDPSYQGQKIGRALLSAAIAQLEQNECWVIGLETRPDRPYNVGFYTGYGFQLTYPTITLTKEVSQSLHPAEFIPSSEVNDHDALQSVTQISQAVQNGLDYAIEFENARKHHWGETLFFGWPATWAIAIIRTVSKRKGNESKVCEIDTLAIQPDSNASLEEVLQAVERFALGQGIARMSLPINAVDCNSLKRILNLGFRVDYVTLRMTLNQQIRHPSEGINLSRWAM